MIEFYVMSLAGIYIIKRPECPESIRKSNHMWIRLNEVAHERNGAHSYGGRGMEKLNQRLELVVKRFSMALG